MILLAVILIVLGLIALAFGSRLAVLGACVGALLGLGLLRLLPANWDSLFWLVIPIGLAILFAIGAGVAKGFINLAVMAIGAFAGGAIVLAVLDLFGLDLGIMDWILVFVGIIAGAVLLNRFQDIALVVLAAIVGALLTVRGLQILLPSIQGWLSSLLGLVLAGGSVAYNTGFLGKRKWS